jgi:hypothetical protein
MFFSTVCDLSPLTAVKSKKSKELLSILRKYDQWNEIGGL